MAASAAIKLVKKIVTREIRKQGNKPKAKKISDVAAAKIARETVGKAPFGRARGTISNKTDMSNREGTIGYKAAERAGKIIEREKKLTGPVTIKKTAGKTPGDIEKNRQAANAAKREKLNKDMKPKKRVVTKPEPRKVVKTKAGGTVSKPKGKVDTKKFKKVTPQDVKDIVTRRMSKPKLDPNEKVNVTLSNGSVVKMTRAKRDALKLKAKNASDNPKNTFAKSRETEKSESLARREIADRNAEERAKDLTGAMNRQYQESGTNFRNPATGKMERTQTNVANPMGESERMQRATKRTVEGTKNFGKKIKPDLKLSPEARKKFAVKKTKNYKIKRGK
jgi:phage pi2 protein 07